MPAEAPDELPLLGERTMVIDSSRIVLAGGLACLVATNMVLVHQNRALKAGTVATAEIDRPVIGSNMGRLSGVDMAGTFKELPEPPQGVGLVIATFSPGCRFCRANHDRWLALSEALDRRRWQMVWISGDPLPIVRDYILTRPIPFCRARRKGSGGSLTRASASSSLWATDPSSVLSLSGPDG
jgi:hypothetical protein